MWNEWNNDLAASDEAAFWPSPRWLLRVLVVYVVAALCGAQAFLIIAAAMTLFSPASVPKPSTYTPPPVAAFSPGTPVPRVFTEAPAAARRAKEALRLISIACSAAVGQRSPPPGSGYVIYRTPEAEDFSKGLAQEMEYSPPTVNAPCVRRSVYRLLSLAEKGAAEQVFVMSFFSSSLHSEQAGAQQLETPETFGYCVPVSTNEQYFPETAGLVIDKGNSDTAWLSKVTDNEICVSGQLTPVIPAVEAHVQVIKVTKIEVPTRTDTVDCNGFKKNTDDLWTAKETKPFDLGTTKKLEVKNTTFGYGEIVVGGVDLATILDHKCLKPQ